MNTALRIVLNTRWPRHYSSRRLFFDDLALDLRKLGFEVEVENWDAYEKFDVAIFRASDQASGDARRRNPEIVVGITKPEDSAAVHARETESADFVISGSIEERDYYLRYNPNIFILHHVERDWSFSRRHADASPVTLGYHGNKAHLEQFYPSLQRALEALARRYPIRLKAVYNVREVGRWEIGRPRIPVVDVQWRHETLAEDLGDVDVGLVPSLTPVPEAAKRAAFRKVLGERDATFGKAPNDYLLRFKNNSNAGRAFVFMQLGIPVVADMTPECCQAIVHGETGFLACSPEGWYDGIERLIRSARLRQEIADRARALLAERYDRPRNVEALAEYISTLAEQKRRGVVTSRIEIEDGVSLRLPRPSLLRRVRRWF